jgi:hypothetical protein
LAPLAQPIAQHQHVRLQLGRQQLRGHGLLAARVGRHLGGHHHVRAALHQAQQARLGKGGLAARGARVTEVLGVGRLVGHVHATAVQRHDTKASIPRTGRSRRGQRPQHTLGKLAHDLTAQPGASLGDR